MKLDEVAPGIHRIESDIGPRFVAQYLLVGEERTVLVDTGLATTPDDALLPALAEVGNEPELIVISHADLDHCGGNRRMREQYPDAVFACHELDRRWIESNATMLAENYRWHEPYGLDGPDEQGQREMLDLLGGDSPIDLGLSGAETIRLGSGRRLEVLHLPGHSPGHIGLWDAQHRVAIIIDAVLYDGIYDRAGAKLIPPRYYDAAAYRETIRRVSGLQPELLLTAHFEPMPRAAAIEFCQRSLDHVDSVEAIVRAGYAGGEVRLRELTDRVNAQLGPFPESATEIAAGVRSHLACL
ncbi:MAG: MBL fold metallo-hydrolase [Solirubrobacterales bacterium]|nr:MBL fold metallo-hydrolase [Solirubrobacterales bacterium]